MANMSLYIRLFGSLSVRCGDREIVSFGTDKNAELLAYLVHYRASSHSRTTLAQMFWPWDEDAPPSKEDTPPDAKSRHNLTQALHSLRKRFDDHAIPNADLFLSNRQTLQINPNVVTTDVAEFESALSAARKASPTARLRPLQQAIKLSELEFQVACYSEWAETERRRLGILREKALEQLQTLEKQFELSDAQSRDVDTADIPLGVSTTFPRLPRPRMRFFGRKQEIEEICRWLRDPEVRLINLTGIGGLGKTRLAIQVGQQVEDRFHTDITFVALAGQKQGQEIPSAILYALGLHESEQMTPLDRIVPHLQGRPTLLILDNFEHLLEQGASILGTLLNRLPELTALVTSRQTLHISGEQEFAVTTLPLPEPDTPLEALRQNPCVALLRDRIRQKRPGFEVTRSNAAAVALLCRKLEGVPLAIELAAGHGRDKTPAQTLKGLEQGFQRLESRQHHIEPRHRSLWAVLEWSYQALTPELQRFYSHLSVFHDGWSEEAASALHAHQSAAMYLNHLVERSLVLAEERGEAMRFRMLDVVREFAKERLPDAEREKVAQEHARYFLDLAKQAHTHLTHADEEDWLDRIEADHANFYAALKTALPDEEPAVTRDISNCLGYFWFVRGRLSEGRIILKRLLPKAKHPLNRARLLNTLGAFAGLQGDYEEAEQAHQECLKLAEAANDPGAKANALGNLGLIAWNRMDFAAARSYYEASLPLDLLIGPPYNVFITRLNLSLVACREEKFVEAKTLLMLNLDQAREMEDQHSRAWVLGNLGQLARLEGDLECSEAHCRESLAILEEVKHEVYMATMLEELAYILQMRGNNEKCLRLIGVARETRRKHDSPLAPVDRIDYDACLTAIRREISESDIERLLSEGNAIALEDAVASILRGQPDL